MNTDTATIKNSDTFNSKSIYAVGDKIQFQCMTGYQRVEGNISLTCNETGHWNGLPLRCEGNVYQNYFSTYACKDVTKEPILNDDHMH
jgi:hypothetical protein